MKGKLKKTVSVTVNGTEHESTVSPPTLLSEYLREHLHLTGTHRGCETAKCGACTVLLDGEPVKSCNILAAQIDGSEILTVEGLGDGKSLHPVQDAFWDCHGMQCGYCTPGFVMAAVALLNENPDPSDDEVRSALAGNICRCTGYTKIVESVQEAGKRMQEGTDE